MGLHGVSTATDAKSCAAAACAQLAQVWQFGGGGNGGCWIGAVADCVGALPDKTWVSGGTTSTPVTTTE